MDSTIAFKGKDFILMAADTTNVYSIMKMKVGYAVIAEPRRQNLAS
jgi:20S proteasome alpha/beta subunit